MIYFIQAGEPGGPIKIGYMRSDRSVERRLGELQVGNPERLHLLAVIEDGGPAQEKLLHRAFASDRMEGEWFRESKSLLGLIDLAQRFPGLSVFDVLAPKRAKPPAATPRITARALRRRAARAAYERALADGSMTIRRLPTDNGA